MRRLLVPLQAVLAAVGLLVLGVGTASAHTLPEAGNRFRASTPETITAVGVSEHIAAGQGRGPTLSQPQFVVATGVAANAGGWSISARMRVAGPGDEFGLPDAGRIRYVPPRGYNPASHLPRGAQGGYIDRFGNEWVVGPSRTTGQPFEWDVQLSRTGQQQLDWLTRDGSHVNVSPLGEVTH